MYSEFCHKSTTKARWTCRNPQLVKYISTLSAFVKLQPFGPAERQSTLLLTFFPLSRRILIANNKYCRTVFSLRTVTYGSIEFQFSTLDLKSNSPRSEATFNLQYCGPFSVRISFSSQSALRAFCFPSLQLLLEGHADLHLSDEQVLHKHSQLAYIWLKLKKMGGEVYPSIDTLLYLFYIQFLYILQKVIASPINLAYLTL